MKIIVRAPHSAFAELVQCLRLVRPGVWLCCSLHDLPGRATTTKRNSTRRAVGRTFPQIQAKIQGARFFIRRLADREPAEVRPKPVPIFYRPATSDAA